MESRSNEEPERSRWPFTHSVSTHMAGTIACDENIIRDADGCPMIKQSYGADGYGVYGDFVALAPGDWHLFAAAPEMLEALKALRNACWGGCACTDPSEEENAAWDLAEATIAKAEGRQG
jgi:hypothetical protein